MRRQLWISAMAMMAAGAAATATPSSAAVTEKIRPLICAGNGSPCTVGTTCCGGYCIYGCPGVGGGTCNSAFACP